MRSFRARLVTLHQKLGIRGRRRDVMALDIGGFRELPLDRPLDRALGRTPLDRVAALERFFCHARRYTRACAVYTERARRGEIVGIAEIVGVGRTPLSIRPISRTAWS